jgi:glutamate-1-semialdehyde 2,1-aminomutase
MNAIDASKLANFQAARERLASRTSKTQNAVLSHASVVYMGSEANRGMPFPIQVERADGARVYDLDGNAYIDVMLGYGTHVLGHRPPAVEAAVLDQIKKGWLFGVHNPWQEQLAARISEAVPSAERVIFCNSGTEATMYAIRGARAFTGRDKVATFDGAYHGAHDYGMLVVDPASSRARPAPIVRSSGVPKLLLQNHVSLPYNDETALDIIEQHHQDIAVVMVEGVQSYYPQLTDRIGGILKQIQELCQRRGIVFLVDELITGFRITFGGAQGHYGLSPDLTTFGKIIGGGFPIGAVGGREDIMTVFKGPVEHQNGIFSGGSLSGNPMSMHAGTAMVEELGRRRDFVYPYINEQTKRLVDRVNGYLLGEGIVVQMLSAGSMFQLFFQRERLKSSRDVRHRIDLEKLFYLQLLDRGVLLTNRRAFLSAAHTPEDVDALAQAMCDVFAAMRSDGVI